MENLENGADEPIGRAGDADIENTCVDVRVGRTGRLGLTYTHCHV